MFLSLIAGIVAFALTVFAMPHFIRIYQLKKLLKHVKKQVLMRYIQAMDFCQKILILLKHASTIILLLSVQRLRQLS